MKKYVVKIINKKEKGLFASKNIHIGEILFNVDLSKRKSYSSEQIAKIINNNHADYIGNGKYVISFHPYSYMNHSCSPNVVNKHLTISKSKFIALKDIKKGEELTYDYGVNAMDQFGKTLWTMKCKCGSESCRKVIYGNFFRQPIEIQKEYYKYLPKYIKVKYRQKFRKLKK